MLVSTLIIFLFFLYIFVEWYKSKYLFERRYITVSIDENGFKIKRASIFRNYPERYVNWSDIVKVYKIEGHDSAEWWYRDAQKRISMGLYWRLIIKTASETFVFHPSSAEGLNIARFAEKFDLSFRLENELLKRNILIEKTDIRLIDTILTKKDWYKNE